MGLEWKQTNVDAKDPVGLELWWQETLGWVVVDDASDNFEIRPAADRLPGLLFIRVPESKTVKNPNQSMGMVPQPTVSLES